jgi:hypothetical protein
MDHKIKINAEQRLYVIPCGDGFSCHGFDNVYRDAVAMAEKMNKTPTGAALIYTAPNPDLIGTLECYDQYQALLGHFTKHPASKRTWYQPGTPKKVQAILSAAIQDQMDSHSNAQILRFFYGDQETGRDWCEENDTIGFIGRTGGTMKTPLLLEPLRYSQTNGELVSAEGGGAILTACIVRIICVSNNVELYRAPNYQMPVFTIEAAKAKGQRPVIVKRDGEVEMAGLMNMEEAHEYVAFMQGLRIARPYRTRQEYMAEMREVA